METKLNVDLKTIVIIAVLLIVGFGGGFKWMNNRFKDVSAQLEQQTIIAQALQEDVKHTKDQLDREVASKTTIQGKLDEVLNTNIKLTENQQELLGEVKRLQEDNTVISAALIETVTKLDSLRNTLKPEVDTINNTIKFPILTDTISFNAFIGNVKPAFKLKEPTFLMTDLKIPNKQLVEFHWENDSEYKQKPVTVSVTNSNSMMKTVNVDSYVIPEVNKNALKPTGWQKFGGFFKNRKSEIIIGTIMTGVGIYIGATAF